jgi:hypothetical protein
MFANSFCLSFYLPWSTARGHDNVLERKLSEPRLGESDYSRNLLNKINTSHLKCMEAIKKKLI